MSYIHFKTVSNSNFDKVTFDGVSLTLSQLKKLIYEKAKYNRNLYNDLEISNASNNEIYKNDNDLIEKNSYVIVKRVVKGSTAPLRSQQSTAPTVPQSVKDANRIIQHQQQQQQQQQQQISQQVTQQQTIQKEVNVSTNVTITTQSLTNNTPQNDLKQNDVLAAISDTVPIKNGIQEFSMEKIKKTDNIGLSIKPTTSQPLPTFHQQQIQMMKGQSRPVPDNYICQLCKKPGHFKQCCPDVAAGLIPKEENRPKFPKGIPRDYMIKANAGDPGAMLGPEGYVIQKLDFNALKVVKKDKTPFLTDEEEEQKKQQSDEANKLMETIPQELTCPFIEHGKHIIKDAVLVPCCGHFVCCDECIRKKISDEEIVVCPNKDCKDYESISLEAITAHIVIRKMVNEYLNDVKLNKINSNKTNTKNDDAFIDLLLNDDFNTINNNDSSPTNTNLTNISPKLNETSTFDLVKNKNDDDIESKQIKTHIDLNDGERPAKSPVQDSNVSSTIALNNIIGAALLPNPPVSHLINKPPLPPPQVPLTTPAPIITKPPSITTDSNPIKSITNLSKPVNKPTQFVDTYSYVGPNMQRPSFNYPGPHMHIHRMHNANIPINTGPIRIPMRPMYRQHLMPTNPYNYPYSNNGNQPIDPNLVYMHPQSQIMPPFMPQNNHYYENNLPTNVRMQKLLSEKEFYEHQEKLKKKEQDLHSFVNDIIVKKKPSSVSRSNSRSRSRSRGRRSRSNSYSSGSNYSSRKYHNEHDTYRRGGGGGGYSGRYRRSNSKTKNRRRTSYSRSRSISRSRSRSSSYNRHHTRQRRNTRSRSYSQTKRIQPIIEHINNTNDTNLQIENKKQFIDIDNKQKIINNESKTITNDKPVTSRVEKVLINNNKPLKTNESRSRSTSIQRNSKYNKEKSRSNSKSKQIIINDNKRQNIKEKEKEKEKEIKKVKNSKKSRSRSRSRSYDDDRKKINSKRYNDDYHKPTQQSSSSSSNVIIKSIVKKPSNDKYKTSTITKTIQNDLSTKTSSTESSKSINDKRKSETADIFDINNEHCKKSKKETINENDELTNNSKKNSKKDKTKDKENDDESEEDGKKSKHKKSKKKHKHNKHQRSTSRD